MSKRWLAVAAIAFALLATTAGGLQLWAFSASDHVRHLVLGVFALSVGASVLTYGVRALRR